MSRVILKECGILTLFRFSGFSTRLRRFWKLHSFCDFHWFWESVVSSPSVARCMVRMRAQRGVWFEQSYIERVWDSYTFLLFWLYARDSVDFENWALFVIFIVLIECSEYVYKGRRYIHTFWVYQMVCIWTLIGVLEDTIYRRGSIHLAVRLGQVRLAICF